MPTKAVRADIDRIIDAEVRRRVRGARKELEDEHRQARDVAAARADLEKRRIAFHAERNRPHEAVCHLIILSLLTNNGGDLSQLHREIPINAVRDAGLTIDCGPNDSSARVRVWIGKGTV